jgi:Response regulators consisting of a CheY-like receiver domain and a winged-helix DNA-binding domain
MRVLLVEDHVDSAVSVGRLLRALGYEVRLAFDGVEGLQSATEFQPAAVFIDLSLPRLDGFSVATRIRAMDGMQGARLIAVAGWESDDCVARARAAGFDMHLVKPLSLRMLTDALATARC